MKFSTIAHLTASIIILSIFDSNQLTIAQSVQTDRTTPTQPESCLNDCMIGGGLQQGENLFHSFERFNVEAGATVLFQDPGVSNILGRVTGNQASEILGTLGVSGGDANLFLINPNGIIFGENSSLDLNGSFLATTADAIRFGEQGLLDTTPNEIPLLTINPSALSFTDGNQGVIRNESVAPAGADLSGLEETASGLRVPDGKSFLLVGGDVIFDGGRVNAFGGRVDLGGLANAGEIQLSFSDTDEGKIDLSFPEQLQRANILLTDKALINVPASDGGDIKIHASNISIENGSILRAGIGANLGNSNSKAGNIILDATENLEIANSTLITNQVAPGGLGNGGNININSGSLEIFDKSRVQTVTFGNGDAGEIEIKVPNSSVEISDESGIVSVVGLIDLDGMKIFGVGNGGDIQIESKNVVIKNKSIIDASTSGQGDAGNISILSNGNINLSLDSGIRSVIDEDAVGDAGNIQIEANNVFLSRGSQLTAAVIGRGKGGNISLDIFNSLNITGFDEAEGRSSGIITATQSDAFGQAGSIQIDSEDFQIAEGAIITSQTLNESDGGNITIDASSFSAIDGGQVVTSAASSGNAGDINIEASDNILLSGSDNNFANRLAEFGEETVGNEAPGNSGFFANVRSEASGEGGNINVAAGQLDINDSAEINVSAEGTGGAGSLSIDAQDVTLDVGSLTAETRVGSQGNVSLNGLDTLLLRNNSQITTNASESAIGGDITISSDGIVLLDNSDITANAVEGQGGNIQITTQGIFQEPDSEITAASELGIDGTVTFNTPEVDPASGIFELPDIPIDADAILAQDLCKLEDEKIAKGSSFVITGRGGLVPTSTGSLENRDRLVDWASRDELKVSNNGTVGIRQREEDSTDESYPEIKQSQGLVVAADGSTWLTANAPKSRSQTTGISHPNCLTIE